MSQHALASPSSAAMWMACPASVTLAEGRVRPSSVYAREGTAAHSIAEMIIEGEMFPPPRIEVEGQQFIVGVEMLRHLNPYISLVQGYNKRGFQTYTEQRVKLSISGGLVWGTADCVAVKSDVIHIVDLKFGRGVPVSPDSAQLKIYALGAMEMFGQPDFIGMVVVQPRLDPKPQGKLMTGQALKAWSRDELEPAVERLVKGDTTEVTGPHCRWCVRRSECSAFGQQRAGMAADVFNDGTVLDAVENSP